ncbi:MAG: hypothetical protein KJN90_08110, partial [Gammaproteobacteria bacterium]|nr:hypothetical protein [Gammaproteobacteria bacterium]
AAKLSAARSCIILILFILSSTFLVFNLYTLNVDLDNLYAEMILTRGQGIYELAWFGGNDAHDDWLYKDGVVSNLLA